jgi:hypothetical protein
MILGSHGIAAVAAAGVLLTATGTAGALCFAGWGGLDWLTRERDLRRHAPRARAAQATADRVRSSLAALSAGHRRSVELAYFGGLDQADMARVLYFPLAFAGRPWRRPWAAAALA